MEYWHLPGPTAFAGALADAVADGRNVVIACPAGIASALARMVRDQRWDLALSPRDWVATCDAPIAQIFEALDIHPVPDSPSVGALVTLIASERKGRPVIVSEVGLEEAAAWVKFISAYEGACRSVSKFDRAPVIIIAGGVPTRLLPVRAAALDILLWDGWVGEADILGYIGQYWRREGRGMDPLGRLCARIITRLALWDFDLVDRLLRLEPRRLFEPVPVLVDMAMEQGGQLGRTWETGGIGHFDGDQMVHSLVLAAEGDPAGELLMRLWAAQAAELLPVLEIRRRALVARMKSTRQHAQRMILNNAPVTDLDEVELGGLAYLARTHAFPQPIQSETERLRWLRNRLSHLKPVTVDDARMVLHTPDGRGNR